MSAQISALARLSWFFLLMGGLGFVAYVWSWFVPLPFHSDGNFTLGIAGIGFWALLRVINGLDSRLRLLEADMKSSGTVS